MRVRIIKASAGIMDSVSLSHLLPGCTYDLPTSLGAFLIGTGAAEELTTKVPAQVIPLDNSDTFHQLVGGVRVVLPGDRANQIPRRRVRT